MRSHWIPLLILLVSAAGTLACSSDDGPAEASTPDVPECGEPCAGMALIAAGSFFMGSPDEEGRPRERPLHPVTFAEPYWFDRYEVTNAEFADFLKANGNVCRWEGVDYPCYDCSEHVEQDQGISCGSWELKTTCQSEPGGQADQSCGDHPVALVFWPGARAYCAWKGKRLPSEAEWERAANGPGGEQGSSWRRFPWGDDCPAGFNTPGLLAACSAPEWTLSTARANCEEDFCNDGWIGTAAIGSFPAGVTDEGVHDMAGNIMEWVEDCFHDSYAPAEGTPPDDGTPWLTDCDIIRRVATGGSFLDDGSNLRAAFRGGDPIDAPEADPDVGFRCARDAN